MIQDFSKYIYYSISGHLENLANANHTIKVYAYSLDETTKQIWQTNFRVNTEFVEPQLIVYSPQNLTTYTNDVPIIYNTNSKILFAYYSLDSTARDIDSWNHFSGNITLAGLSQGSHKLIIAVTTEANTQSAHGQCTQAIDFYVDASPEITQLSITNKTYNNQNILLSFNLSENVSWIAYNLDNQGNTTLQGNTILSGLAFGSHSIVVYANDTVGNMGKTDTIFFDVKPNDTYTLTFVLIGVIALAGIGLGIYFKKYHKK